MGKYEIKVEKVPTGGKVTISGVIDEDADFNPHVIAGMGHVDFYLNDVKSINSCGIREWIKWVGTAGSADIHYHQCPKMIVDQINMVQGFLPQQGRVMSFYVPYFNEDSGSEKNVLFTYGKEFTESGIQAPGEVKDDSGNAMEMDVVEAKYFKFLKK